MPPIDLSACALERIAAVNGTVTTFSAIRANESQRDPETTELEILARSYEGSIHGIRLSFKTAGCLILAQHIPRPHATNVGGVKEVNVELSANSNMLEPGTSPRPRRGVGNRAGSAMALVHRLRSNFRNQASSS
jgi:hypothetical protein